MKELKVLIAPWGDPKMWREVEYEYEGEVFRGKDTIPLLARKLGVENCIIVASDTLIDSIIGLEKEIAKHNVDLIKEIRGSDDRIADKLTSLQAELGKFHLDSYSEVAELVRRYVNYFVKQYIGNSVETNIFIGYGTGEFNNALLTGESSDFYYKFIADLVGYLIKEKHVLDYERLVIYLDTTHGINYFTISVYKAVRVVSALLANIMRVKVVTFNTDPYIPSVKRKQPLKVHKTEEIWVEPYTSIYLNVDVSELQSEDKQLVYFLTSAKFALLLLTLYFIPRYDLYESITQVLKDLEEGFVVYHNSNESRLEIIRQFSLEALLEIKVKAFIWQQMIMKIFAEEKEVVNKEVSYEDIYSLVTNEGLSLNELDRFAKSLRNPFSLIAQEEIEHIRHKVVKQGRPYTGVRYDDDSEWLKRNLIAHAGFIIEDPISFSTNDDKIFKIRQDKEILGTVREILLQLARMQ